MLNENKNLEKVLKFGRKIIPKSVFRALQPIYHWSLSVAGSVLYGFPSQSMKVIGVTGTHGKTTTIFMITRALQALGEPTAAIGGLEFRIKDRSWPNSLKMTMPGRFKLQKFLSSAKKARCKYVVMEVTSEGIKQMRHLGVKFDCAVFTNLALEHIEHHGSFGKYMAAKQKLFKATKRIQVINKDDRHFSDFNKFQADRKIRYGLRDGDVNQADLKLKLKLTGEFNIYNALAALSVIGAYGLDVDKAKSIIEKLENVAGRMEFVQREPFSVVVDYAHTPHALEEVYKELKPRQGGKLICVFGATGGGRDKWKRPVFGEVADRYCDEIYLTNDDPYDEDQLSIIEQIKRGIKDQSKIQVILDRGQAIESAIKSAKPGDGVVVTGKGSEDRIVFANGQKLPWSDKEEAEKALNNLTAKIHA